MENLILRLFGFLPTVLFGDAAVFDRWLWLKRHLGRGRTLDAGCGSGAFAIYAAKRGNEAVGISFDERNNKVASERAKLLGVQNVSFLSHDLRRLDELAEKLGTFDQAICFETIEHIVNDKKLLRDIRGMLNPGGELLLTAPYTHYKRIMGNKISEVENGDHVRWGYTHEEIESLLKEAGFAVKTRDYVTGAISQWLILLYRALSRVLPYQAAWAVVLPFRLLTVLNPVVTKLLRYPYLSIAIVAERN